MYRLIFCYLNESVKSEFNRICIYHFDTQCKELTLLDFVDYPVIDRGKIEYRQPSLWEIYFAESISRFPL